MSGEKSHIREIDLIAYADGRLDPVRWEDVEAYLHRHPNARARVREYMAQNKEIRSLYAPVLREPIPSRLEAVLKKWDAPKSSRLRPFVAAGLTALLIATLPLGWLAGRSGWADGLRELLGRAIGAGQSSQSSAPAQVQGSSDPAEWLAQRLGFPVHLPDLSAYGFSLAEKHLSAFEGEPAVEVIYRGENGREVRFFLSVRWDDSGASQGGPRRPKAGAVYWLDGPLALAVEGNLSGQELLWIAGRIGSHSLVMTPEVTANPPTPRTQPSSPSFPAVPVLPKKDNGKG